MLEREPGGSTHFAVRPPAGRELVDAADDGDRGVVGDRPAVPDRAERRLVAARDAKPPALGGVALPDPLREPAAVGLGLDRLSGPALPLVLVGGQDALVGEQDHRAPGVEVVAGVDRSPQVPGEPGHVADDEDLPVVAGTGEHLGPLAGGGDRPPGVGHLPGSRPCRAGPSARWRESAARPGRRARSCPPALTSTRGSSARRGGRGGPRASGARRGRSCRIGLALRLHGDDICSAWRRRQGQRGQSSAGRGAASRSASRWWWRTRGERGICPLPAVGAAAGERAAGVPAVDSCRRRSWQSGGASIRGGPGRSSPPRPRAIPLPDVSGVCRSHRGC